MDQATLLAVVDPYRFRSIERFEPAFIFTSDTTRQGGAWLIRWQWIYVAQHIPTPVRFG